MKWPKRTRIYRAALMALLFLLAGCGVRGDPLPPERPPELGRGRPTYRRATENIQIRKAGRADEDDDADKDEATDNGENE